jgi:hypothetical protein
MSISAISSSAYTTPVPSLPPSAAPPPRPAAVDKPHDGDADDGVGVATPAGAASLSSASTQAALTTLKAGG